MKSFDEYLTEGWKDVSSESDYHAAIKQHHPDAEKQVHDNDLHQHTVGPRKVVVGHWDPKHKSGKVKIYEQATMLVESRFDHREAATHGIIHPESAEHAKVGQHSDFYSKTNGDKLYGKVTKNDGKHVSFKHSSGVHSFKVSHTYPTLQESFKDDVAEGDEIIFEEVVHTQESAKKRAEELNKKFPSTKHTAMQGKKTGAWHVVRHTSGGMHIMN